MERVMVGRPGLRHLGLVAVAFTLIAGLLALPAPDALLAQESEGCEVTELGTLSTSGSPLAASGSWTTEDCDSRFRPGSDAHTYRFRVAEAGRVRVDLMSAGADSYVYLLAEDGSRIADDDDGGANLDARVERDLAPGIYMIEATTVGGRSRGAADFAIAVSRVTGCEPVHLGTLEPGADLAASGSWTLDTCGSRFVVEHPAHGYTFNLDQAGRVRIDLKSEDGDPVLSLASLSGGIIGANDDGGDVRNARIERYLPAGLYSIEATTYLERDYQPLRADFDLTVHLVDEQAEQKRSRLKIEEVHTPAEVVTGDPFPVHYRAGNLGGDLAAGGYALLYVVGPRVFELIGPVAGIWEAGVSYHSGSEAASGVSTAIDDLDPLEVSFGRPGPTWVFVAVVTYDAYGDETGFQGLWHNLMVLDGPTFGPVDVRVDGATYTVAAEADDEGEVTTSVVSAAGPDAEVDPIVRSRAIYTAGVQTQLLDGVFERPGIEPLAEGADPAPVTVGDLSTAALLETIGQRYVSATGASGLSEAWAAGEALNPIAIEQSILDAAGTASAQYASMATSWRSLLRRIERGGTLSFEEALHVQSQVGYAESVVAAATTAGGIVEAARASDDGWEDPDVRAMIREAGCRPGANALGDALAAAGATDVDGLLALDAEMRALRPVHGVAVDSALCAVETVNAANLRFLRRLSINNIELRESLGLGRPLALASSPEPQRLRIIARLGEDGRLEHGVELAGGERVLPPERFLGVDGPAGSWQVSGDVEVGGASIGRIRARPVAGGRFELGFVSADGETIVPGIRYLPSDLAVGVWYRSSEIEVPVAMVMDSADSAEE